MVELNLVFFEELEMTLPCHDRLAQVDDGLHNEGNESALQRLAVLSLAFGLYLLGLRVVVVLTPETLGHGLGWPV